MKRLIAAAAFASVFAISACSGGSSTNAHVAGGTARVQHHGTATITIMDFGYTGDLTVKAGERVTVVNRDSVAHTLTDKNGGQFDTGTIAGGGSGSFVAPMKPGMYPFGCTIHPEMTGVLTVTSA